MARETIAFLFELGNRLDLIAGPIKKGQMRDAVDAILEGFDDVAPGSFLLRQIQNQLSDLSDQLSRSDPDEPVERESHLYEQLSLIRHRAALSREFEAQSELLRHVRDRLAMLPVDCYGMESICSSITDPDLRSLFARAMAAFERRDFKSTLQECGEAGERLSQHLLDQSGARSVKDFESGLRGQTRRLEWLLFHGCNFVRYLRNLASHDQSAATQLPEQQDARRRQLREDLDAARASLAVALLVAREFQELR